MKDLHLFTPIIEANYNTVDLFVCLSEGTIVHTYINVKAKRTKEGLTKKFYTDIGAEITHILDLSKLTTKERAVKALENSMLDDSLEPMTGTEIIEKFESEL